MSSTVQRIDVVKGHRLCAGREKLWRRLILALDRLFALNRLLALGLLLGLMVAGTGSASGLPAFARKTGLRCSACHEAWPKLSPFGQTFRDNGYQIGNERDSPVYLSPFYWPIAVRYTPQWHAERNSAVATDQAASGVQPVSTQGFDGSGVDLWFAGLLSKNISFVILPSSDEYGNFHFESGWVRFDNLLGSTWLNLKGGKFELDTLVSEKRMTRIPGLGRMSCAGPPDGRDSGAASSGVGWRRIVRLDLGRGGGGGLELDWPVGGDHLGDGVLEGFNALASDGGDGIEG